MKICEANLVTWESIRNYAKIEINANLRFNATWKYPHGAAQHLRMGSPWNHWRNHFQMGKRSYPHHLRLIAKLLNHQVINIVSKNSDWLIITFQVAGALCINHPLSALQCPLRFQNRWGLEIANPIQRLNRLCCDNTWQKRPHSFQVRPLFASNFVACWMPVPRNKIGTANN